MNKVTALALFFVMFAPATSFAQTAGTIDCDPLPEDPDQLLACLDYINENPQNVDSSSESIDGTGDGSYGMSLAYNTKNNTFLMAADAGRGQALVVQVFDATTGQAVSQPVTLDETNLFTGSAKAIYNPVTDNYFVMWGDERDGSSLYANFVAPDGSKIGNNFKVAGTVHPGSGGVELDLTNNRYLVYYEYRFKPALVTVNFDGSVNQWYSYDQHQGKYQGQTNAEYVPDNNEYWFVYILIESGSDTAQEDLRVMLGRVSAETMEIVGEPIQLNNTRIGRNAFGSPAIEYSSGDKASVVAWLERGNPPGTVGVYGCTVYPNLTKTCNYPILTTSQYQTSDFYGAPTSLVYNPYTGTFYMAVEDNNYATSTVEFLYNGTPLEYSQAIPQISSNGNFNPTATYTSNGFIAAATGNNTFPKFTLVQSNFVLPPETSAPIQQPRQPDVLDTKGLAQQISQIYIYSLGIAGLLAVAMSVLGGYLVMTARGNASQASKGKDFIYSAIAGLVLLMAAYLILNTINSDLLNFDIPSFQNLTTGGNESQPQQ